MYNKKLLLFDMEVGYQSELKWNLQAKMIIAGFMSLNLKSPMVQIIDSIEEIIWRFTIVLLIFTNLWVQFKLF